MITFIAPAYNEPYAYLTFIGSMLTQIDHRWKAVIYHNGPNEKLKNLVNSFSDSRLVYKESKENTGAWGCYNRIDALNYIDTEYVLQTSVQDYFTPNSVTEILNRAGSDIIIWNSLHHYFGWDELKSETQPGRIDWGNFAVKTHIARQVGINYPGEFMGDWLFVKDVLDSGLIKTTSKIEKILTIHN